MAKHRWQYQIERRKGERRKRQMPFEGSDRRRGRDRRRYVRRVMLGEELLPEREDRDLR
jgi:hypothetical protein